MQEIIEELKKREIVDTLQVALNNMYKMSGGKHDEKAHMRASKGALKSYIAGLDDEDELLDKIFDLAMDMVVEAIIKELDLKPDENYKPSELEKALVGFAMMKRFMKEDK